MASTLLKVIDHTCNQWLESAESFSAKQRLNAEQSAAIRWPASAAQRLARLCFEHQSSPLSRVQREHLKPLARDVTGLAGTSNAVLELRLALVNRLRLTLPSAMVSLAIEAVAESDRQSRRAVEAALDRSSRDSKKFLKSDDEFATYWMGAFATIVAGGSSLLRAEALDRVAMGEFAESANECFRALEAELRSETSRFDPDGFGRMFVGTLNEPWSDRVDSYESHLRRVLRVATRDDQGNGQSRIVARPDVVLVFHHGVGRTLALVLSTRGATTEQLAAGIHAAGEQGAPMPHFYEFSAEEDPYIFVTAAADQSSLELYHWGYSLSMTCYAHSMFARIEGAEYVEVVEVFQRPTPGAVLAESGAFERRLPAKGEPLTPADRD